MVKVKTRKIIDIGDWDQIVQDTYGKPYSFQQQYGCQDRGLVHLEVPSDYCDEDEMNEVIPERVNGPLRGVKFDVWLARDPKQPLAEGDPSRDFSLKLWWYRNFYPDLGTLTDDLLKKGLIEEGTYYIDIDW